MNEREKLKRTFTLTVEVSETLTYDEIWPDGDAPENPTTDDVLRAFYGEDYDIYTKATTCGIGYLLENWGLEPRAHDLVVTDDRAFIERMERLKAKAGNKVVDES